MSSQLANRLWAAIGNKPKQEGINVVQVHQATWRTQPIGHIKPAYGYAYTALFAVALAAFLAYPGIWEEVAKWNDWVESLKVLGGNISFLDFCGSAMTCFAFRRSQEQAIARNDKKVLQLHASPLAHYATTIITCTFLQFGGTTTTAVLLGQNASWAAGTHVWSALLLAWWLTFSFPGDLWYKAMHTPFLFLPLKIGQTISSGHAVSSWGVEKALTAEHVRMRGSVWGALACGFFSASFGWVMVEYFQAGGAGLLASCPSWAMQRAYYAVLLYYGLTDPHSVLRAPRLALATFLTPLNPLLGGVVEGAEAWSKSDAKVAVLFFFLVLLFGQDFGGVDLLVPANGAMGRAARLLLPINMHTTYLPPDPTPAVPAVAAGPAAGKEGEGGGGAKGKAKAGAGAKKSD
mmetsp:Transcript_3596/g.8485  ORF Transcript_3596/g.8485 Transcript_3596/m.8485 type:complete len:404 (-) Transcript_3596:43-1254(-)|eukprot:CAMPEP_0177713948 /NCGR_PEP_ID=MMETSP0484_2-20121128/13207_1 /TAXON_ID=354590 /ORGANISM="Rhodomonas lens, Strain RHODO" /LENGTH=403 /DNA_ID=CAMNT_0019225863 /DNA_START=72 /DNA_END=1283 /DNA_ORIENTATION=-